MSVVFVRRWFLAFFTAIGIIIIVLLSIRKSYSESNSLEPPTKVFQWVDIDNLTEFRPCRNSIQGAFLIVDDRGFVCHRSDLSASGCCHSSGVTTRRYKCADCQNNNCCSVYEHCVSCCLNPVNRNLLEVILNNPVASAPSLISQSVGDQFELCLVKCRTSSKANFALDPKWRPDLVRSEYCLIREDDADQWNTYNNIPNDKSVWHENSYKDKKYKHCFGLTGPDFAGI